ncbi:hypothetical protein HMPREF3214_00475 [Alloscardovia omnicolens]|nr:hypothetical protein HMPREF3214_00475 [Alloscardovia omnicolens]
MIGQHEKYAQISQYNRAKKSKSNKEKLRMMGRFFSHYFSNL